MKRAERRHLKQNEVANWVTRAVDLIERRRGAVLTAGAVVVAAMVAWGGFSAYQARSNAEASEILAQAIGVMNATVIPPPAPLGAAPLDATAPSDANATDESDTAPTPATPLPVPPQPPGSFPSDRAKREAALVKFVEAAETQPNGLVGLTARVPCRHDLCGARTHRRSGRVVSAGQGWFDWWTVQRDGEARTRRAPRHSR